MWVMGCSRMQPRLSGLGCEGTWGASPVRRWGHSQRSHPVNPQGPARMDGRGGCLCLETFPQRESPSEPPRPWLWAGQGSLLLLHWVRMHQLILLLLPTPQDPQTLHPHICPCSRAVGSGWFTCCQCRGVPTSHTPMPLPGLFAGQGEGHGTLGPSQSLPKQQLWTGKAGGALAHGRKDSAETSEV